MAELTVQDILEATGGVLATEGAGTFGAVSTDSRTVGEGELFIALNGDKYDGHDFVDDALAKAGGAMVQARPEHIPEGKVVIIVDDTLLSLQNLAHFVRMQRDIPVVAVTGSNGKTTTKEMIYEICSGRVRTLKNEGNLNNHIGLPMSILKIRPEHELLVLEMGMNAEGEIRRLCEIASPTYGVITNVGTAHIGRLGGYDGVRNAKLELLPGLRAACVNADDRGLMDGVRGMMGFDGRLVTFGMEHGADVTAADIEFSGNTTGFTLNIRDTGSARATLGTTGIFNVYNALAASAVCSLLGFGPGDTCRALEGFRPYALRFEVIEAGGVRIINDSYNANPSSMDASLRELARIAGSGRKVAVLGDMFELGEFADDAHREMAALAVFLGTDVIITVGDCMGMAAERVGGAGIHTFADADEACEGITSLISPGDTVLVKGSRSMALEKIVEKLKHAL